MTAARSMSEEDFLAIPPPLRPLMARYRRIERDLARCRPYEARIVALLVERAKAEGGRWTPAVVHAIAGELGLSATTLYSYLLAVRRTLGLPVVAQRDTVGPLVRDEAWVRRARKTHDWGVFGALVPEGWTGVAARTTPGDGKRRYWPWEKPLAIRSQQGPRTKER